MSGIEQLLQEPVAQAIGWALLHFVWQGALVGVLAAVALAVLHCSDADVRYVVGAIALAVMATLPAVTAVQSHNAEAWAKSEPASTWHRLFARTSQTVWRRSPRCRRRALRASPVARPSHLVSLRVVQKR